MEVLDLFLCASKGRFRICNLNLTNKTLSFSENSHEMLVATRTNFVLQRMNAAGVSKQICCDAHVNASQLTMGTKSRGAAKRSAYIWAGGQGSIVRCREECTYLQQFRRKRFDLRRSAEVI